MVLGDQESKNNLQSSSDFGKLPSLVSVCSHELLPTQLESGGSRALAAS